MSVLWKKKGRSITDRLLAARYTITGQDLAKSVCKATTDEAIAPKRKHLDYLVYCTNRSNVQMCDLAKVLFERSRSASWIVVFKALITTHYILIHGNERFVHYLASFSNTFELAHFLNRCDTHGYAMSPYIRRYANYLNRKVSAYRTVASDFCKAQSDNASVFITMSDDELLETLALVQDVLDALLQFGSSADDLCNGIIVMAVNLLFRDLIRLYAFYNEGVINLLRRYFDMKKKQCQEALVLYKNFLKRLEWIPGFIKLCETTGFSTGDLTGMRNAPDSLLDALIQHLSSLDTEKHSANNASSGYTLRNKRSEKSDSGGLLDLWLQPETQKQTATDCHKKVSIPEETRNFHRSSFRPSVSNEICKTANTEPKSNFLLDVSEKLDVLFDDPIKLIRNPFVSPQVLATKPAFSPAEICTFYATAPNPSYTSPRFVSDEDFATAFQRAEENSPSKATNGVKAVTGVREENFLELKNNFSLCTCKSVASPYVNELRNSAGWRPQQLSSITAPGYIPMCSVARPASSPDYSNTEKTWTSFQLPPATP